MKANNRYMKDYDKYKESSYLMYWDVKNLCEWEMSRRLPIDGLKLVKNTSQGNEDSIKNYNKDSDEGYFLEVDIQYPEELHKLHNDLFFLTERMKIEKVEKLVTNMDDKKEDVIHIKILKQALSHELVLRKTHRVIKFNQKAWLNHI